MLCLASAGLVFRVGGRFDELFWLPPKRNIEVVTSPLDRSRDIAYERYGASYAPRGIILFHGMPGSGAGPFMPWQTPGLPTQLLSCYRSGHGSSSSHPGRTVGTATWEMGQIADHHNLRETILIARSGGVPYALSYASMFPNRVKAVGLLVPPVVPRWDSSSGRQEAWARAVGLADLNMRAIWGTGSDIERELRHLTRRITNNPLDFLEGIVASDLDSDPELVAAIRSQYNEAMKLAFPDDGVERTGWIEDVNAIWRTELDVAIDVRCPVHVWNASTDPFAPDMESVYLGRGNRPVRETGKGGHTEAFRQMAKMTRDLIAIAGWNELASGPERDFSRQ